MTAMEFKDYYAVLGLAREASAEDIKKAFRRLARKYHPDVSKEPDAAAKMAEVNEANTVLGDAERRAEYDAMAERWRRGERFTPPPDWDEGFEFRGSGDARHDFGEFSDFFEQMFGRSGAWRQHAPGGGGARRAGPAPGADHHAKIVLELADAMRGATRRLTLHAPRWDAGGHASVAERTLEVTIPPGVKPGQLIRLAGQGEPGQGGAAAGDLFLEVAIRKHPRFDIDGADLVAELPVAPWEAALGGVVPVELPDGSSLNVRVPPGAQSGRVLSVRGRGLGGAKAGDLQLKVRVLLPSGLDPRARRLYESMAAELKDFDARAQAAAERSTSEAT